MYLKQNSTSIATFEPDKCKFRNRIVLYLTVFMLVWFSSVACSCLWQVKWKEFKNEMGR